MIEVTECLSIPDEELRFTASHSSGPGGQNVNKVSTRVTLWFDVLNSPSLSQERKRPHYGPPGEPYEQGGGASRHFATNPQSDGQSRGCGRALCRTSAQCVEAGNTQKEDPHQPDGQIETSRRQKAAQPPKAGKVAKSPHRGVTTRLASSSTWSREISCSPFFQMGDSRT